MRTAAPILALALAGLATACNSGQTPAEIRHDTSDATASVVKDTREAAHEIKSGAKAVVHQATSADRGPQGHPVDINRASRLNLMTLPGVDSKLAKRIIANRPYALPDDLLNRGIVESDEFDRISPRIITVN